MKTKKTKTNLKIYTLLFSLSLLLLSFNFFKFFTAQIAYAQQPAPTPAATPAATAATPAATGTTPSISTPFQGGGAAQTSKLAIIMSIIVGILAITVPWNIISEVAAPLTAGAKKALDYGKKGLKLSGAETSYQKGLMKAKNSDSGKAVAKWYNKKFGEGKRTEEALQKQTSDIQAEANYDIYWQALQKAGGDDKKLDAYTLSLGKMYGGKNLESVADDAASSTSGSLEDKVKDAGGIDMIKGMNEKDGDLIGNARKKGKAKDIASGIGALSRQLSDPTKRKDAMESLKRIADQSGVTVDQLLTMDLRTFKLGNAIDRPGAHAINLSAMQPHVKALRDDFKQTSKSKTGSVIHSPTGTAAATAVKTEITKKETEEMARAQNLGSQLTSRVEEMARSRGTSTDEANDYLHIQVTDALKMVDSNPQEAIARGKQLGLAVYDGMGDEELKTTLKRTESFAGGYKARRAVGGSHASAAYIGTSRATDMAKADTRISEATATLSRVAGITLTAADFAVLKAPVGTPTATPPPGSALAGMKPSEVQSLRDTANQLP